MNNRLDHVLSDQGDLLNIYYTAGFPELHDTLRIAKVLEGAGCDMIELGMPYSDPIADGPTIQESSTTAIQNGMTIPVLFEQLVEMRKKITIPVILMGYLNPIIQFGIEKFAARCQEVGIDGVIIPDLPMHDYLEQYKSIFQNQGLHNIFLITPQTSVDRIRVIDEFSSGFIYMVSSASVTGAKTQVTSAQTDYFKRIQSMGLKSRKLIGFGISNRETFQQACAHADGAIIGSAFIKQLSTDASDKGIESFVKSIKS